MDRGSFRKGPEEVDSSLLDIPADEAGHRVGQRMRSEVHREAFLAGVVAARMSRLCESHPDLAWEEVGPSCTSSRNQDDPESWRALLAVHTSIHRG
jgi:hypothetical protein